MDIDIVFQESQNNVREKLTNLDTNTLLKLYGLYKQGTVGNNIYDEPNILFFKEYCKWESWNKYQNISLNKAKKKFIKYANSLLSS